MNLQSRYELAVAADTLQQRIEAEVSAAGRLAPPAAPALGWRLVLTEPAGEAVR